MLVVLEQRGYIRVEPDTDKYQLSLRLENMLLHLSTPFVKNSDLFRMLHSQRMSPREIVAVNVNLPCFSNFVRDPSKHSCISL